MQEQVFKALPLTSLEHVDITTLTPLELETAKQTAEQNYFLLANKSRLSRDQDRAMTRWYRLKLACQVEQQKRQEANRRFYDGARADTKHALTMQGVLSGGRG